MKRLSSSLTQRVTSFLQSSKDLQQLFTNRSCLRGTAVSFIQFETQRSKRQGTTTASPSLWHKAEWHKSQSRPSHRSWQLRRESPITKQLLSSNRNCRWFRTSKEGKWQVQALWKTANSYYLQLLKHQTIVSTRLFLMRTETPLLSELWWAKYKCSLSNIPQSTTTW